MHNRLSIIILCWNDPQATLACIQQFTNWTSLKPKFFVVDNASSPTFEGTFSKEINLVVIRSEVNKGYAGGNNLGISRALSEGFEYLMLLNSDVSIGEETTLLLLERFNQNPELSAVGPLIYEGDEIHAGGRDIAIHPQTRMLWNDQLMDLAVDMIDVDYIP